MKRLTRWKGRYEDRVVTQLRRASHELNPEQLKHSSSRISGIVRIINQALSRRKIICKPAVKTAAARRASSHSMMHPRNKLRKGKLKGRALFLTKYRQIKKS